MTAKAKMFKDESIWQGIKEFNTPCGRLRVQNNGATRSIYQEQDNAFIHVGEVSKEIKGTVAIYEEARKAGFFN